MSIFPQNSSAKKIFEFVLVAVALCIVGAIYLTWDRTEVPVLDKTKVFSQEQHTSSKNIPAKGILKIAVGAMISPKDTEGYYRQLLQYLGDSVGMNIEFAQRKTYAEINTLLEFGSIDLAFICSGPYVLGAEREGLRLLATPKVHGRLTYQSYLIVHKDSSFTRLEELKGKSFAFTDPDSNTGSLVPRYWLKKAGFNPQDFFRETFYTYSHDNSIFAVAKGLVDGAAVDSLIWDYYTHNKSLFTAKTRIIQKSDEYGIPPIVASPALSAETSAILQNVLLTMHENAKGKAILQELLIDRFVLPEDSWYGSIRVMYSTLYPQEQP